MHEYHRESALSERLNRALIVLHKDRLAGARPTPAEVTASAQDLAAIIDGLLDLLRPEEKDTVKSDVAARVPPSLVVRIQAERSGNLEYYVEDLEHISAKLRAQPGAVTTDDLDRIEDLAAAADIEASSVFRRLMRM